MIILKTRNKIERTIVIIAAALLVLVSFISLMSSKQTDAAKREWYPSNVSQLATGLHSSCLTENEVVYCWGNGAATGTNTSYGTVSSLTPLYIKGELAGKSVSNVYIFSSGGCAVADGSAYCWGSDQFGQMGTGSQNEDGGRSVPTKTGIGSALEGKNITKMVGNNGARFAIADGKLYSWGWNPASSRLGYSTGSDVNSTPMQVGQTGVLANKVVTDISNDGQCAVANGAVYCWGDGSEGALGNGSNVASATPVAVTTSGVLSGKTVTKVVGSSTKCAIADGSVYCWGKNGGSAWGGVSMLGNASTAFTVNTPVAVNASGFLANKTITDIASTGSATCALSSGSVYCWGRNNDGQLGNGTYTDSSVPTAVNLGTVLENKQVTTLDGFGYHSNCVVAEGDAACWGDNSYGLLGNGTDVEKTANPTLIDKSNMPNGTAITSVALSQHNFACAVAGGGVYCWGQGYGGVLGNGSSQDINYSTPVRAFGNDLVPEISYVSLMSSLEINQSGVTAYISGNDFDDAAVKVGDVPATVASQSSNHIEIIVPASNTVGKVDVKVTNNNGEVVTYSEGIEYDDYKTPTISYISNTQTYINEAATTTVYGANFDDDATVKIGTVDAEVTSRSSTAITVNVPISSTGGTVDVAVYNGARKSVLLPSSFTYNEQVNLAISNLSPNEVTLNAIAQIQINGNGFEPESRISVDGRMLDLADIGYGSETILYFMAPVSETEKSVSVTVTNPSGSSVTLDNALHYKQPDPKHIAGAAFSTLQGRKILTVTGTSLTGAINPTEYAEAVSRSLVTLNGIALPFCTENVGADAAYFIANGTDPTLVSDTPACYILVDSNGIAMTRTTAKIYLNNDFDTTAQGTVSVNGSNIFTFNSRTVNPGNGGSESQAAEPTAIVGNKSLESVPTINKRPIFSGTAEPGAIVAVTVRSDPITCTATADNNGNWSCMLPSDLPAGNHTVTVVVTNPDGSTEQLGPYAVVVQNSSTASIVTNLTPLAPNTGQGKMLGMQNNHIVYSILIALAVFTFSAVAAHLKRYHTNKRSQRTRLNL